MKILFWLSVFFSFSVFGQETIEGISACGGELGNILAPFMEKYPKLVALMAFTASSRYTIKPLVSFLMILGEKIPDGKVRLILRDLSDNPIYKLFAYILDVVASVKLPQKKK